MPFDGTPYENTWELSPARCVKILAMARFVAPATEIRIAAGREMHLRSLQATALHVANSIFLGDYLTSEGQDALADLHLLRDNGFTILGTEPGALDRLIAEHEAGVAHRAHATTPCGTGCGDGCGGCAVAQDPDQDADQQPTIRRRGAGTEVAANA
jgi:biotin synthase